MQSHDEFFYLSPVEDLERIKSEGIQANEDGEIVIFSDFGWVNEIAKQRVFAIRGELGGTIGVVRINPDGIQSELMPKLELPNPYRQFIVKQSAIGPEHLIFAFKFDTVHTLLEVQNHLLNKWMTANLITTEMYSAAWEALNLWPPELKLRFFWQYRSDTQS